MGSPPRMREIHIHHRQSLKDFGITPAYAGNTRSNRTAELRAWDHPRVCGKYFSSTVLATLAKGSPPRMREIPIDGLAVQAVGGITPAYAGNTRTQMGVTRTVQDHPRVCGKYFVILRLGLCEKGSPPRMREILSKR